MTNSSSKGVRLLALVAVAFTGCGRRGESVVVGPPACVAGAHAACVCADGTSGSQRCAPESRSYEACACEPPPEDPAVVALRGLAALRDRACACRDEGCNQEVERDFRDLADRYRNLVFDDDQREQVSTLASEMTVCLMNVVTGNLAASDDEIASTTVETCDAYVASIAALVRCDNVDDEERAKLRAGRDRLLGGLGDLSAARETERAQASDACLMALNAVRTGARGMGCAVE